MAKTDPRERSGDCTAASPRDPVDRRVFTTELPVTGAAIVEMTEMNPGELVCATDDVSEALKTLQFTLSEGP